MTTAIAVLKSEHRSISAVLHGLQQLAADLGDSSLRPEYGVFHAMIRYIDQYPERLHHPKEDRFLFERLAQRAPQARPLIDALRAEHVTGARLVRELEHALLTLEIGYPGSIGAFRAAVEGYAEFHWAHMRKEEQELLPLAERHLTPEDWSAIDAAFAGNEDPISDLRDDDFRRLFSRIVSLAPAPVGLGEPWRRAAP